MEGGWKWKVGGGGRWVEVGVGQASKAVIVLSLEMMGEEGEGRKLMIKETDGLRKKQRNAAEEDQGNKSHSNQLLASLLAQHDHSSEARSGHSWRTTRFRPSTSLPSAFRNPAGIPSWNDLPQKKTQSVTN